MECPLWASPKNLYQRTRSFTLGGPHCATLETVADKFIYLNHTDATPLATNS